MTFSVINQINNYLLIQTLVLRTQRSLLFGPQLVVLGTYQLTAFFLTKFFPNNKKLYILNIIFPYIGTYLNYIVVSFINTILTIKYHIL